MIFLFLVLPCAFPKGNSSRCRVLWIFSPARLMLEGLCLRAGHGWVHGWVLSRAGNVPPALLGSGMLWRHWAGAFPEQHRLGKGFSAGHCLVGVVCCLESGCWRCPLAEALLCVVVLCLPEPLPSRQAPRGAAPAQPLGVGAG